MAKTPRKKKALDFRVGDLVVTNFCGALTLHRVTEIRETRNSETGWVVEVKPLSGYSSGGALASSWYRRATDAEIENYLAAMNAFVLYCLPVLDQLRGLRRTDV